MLVPAGLLLVAGANAHLVYVAVQSQPDCVAHLKSAAKMAGYRAASQRAEEVTMGETDKSYWLLSETSSIGETRDPRLDRHLPFWKGCAGSRQAGAIFGPVPLPAWHTACCVFLLSVCLRVDAGRFRARLHPVSRPGRVHDRGAVPGHRPLREKPGDRGGEAGEPSARCSWCAPGPARKSSSRACCFVC